LEVRVGDDELEYLAVAGSLAGREGMRLGLATSLSGLAVGTGAVQCSHDTESDPRVDRAATRLVGARSLLCVPLAGAQEHVAVLKLSAEHPDAFAATDADALARLAAFLTVAIEAAA